MSAEPGFRGDIRILPTFEASRQEAFRLLSDAADELRSDWRPDRSPTPRQLAAARRALRAIGDAKNALDEAARR